MGKYLLKRLLFFIPTLFAITLISFSITVNSPNDPVESLIGKGSDLELDQEFMDAEYLRKRALLGFDLPLFYFTVGSLADPDTLHHIPRPDDQSALAEMVARYGNWDQISAYYHSIWDASRVAGSYRPSSEESEYHILYRTELLTLRHAAGEELRAEYMASLDTLAGRFTAQPNGILASWQKVKAAWLAVEQESTPWKTYVPMIRWHGAGCQYHQWLMRLIRLDLGTSLQDGKPVTTRIGEALRWSIFISLFVVVVAYAGSVWLGTYAAVHHNSRRERMLAMLLFLLHSLPAFWVATLLINFFATPDYFKLFPAGGVMSDTHANLSWTGKLADYAWHLTLPTLCYLYGVFTVLSRQMRSGMLEVFHADFIRTARAKGLPEKKVIWRHAFRNSLIPLITAFASVFPNLVGGSIIIERIFGIPGMGREVILAVNTGDYPVVIGVFTLTAILTLLGIFVSDVLYSVADPRISFQRK